MWFFKWKKYVVSGAATAVSVIGTVLRYLAMLGVIDLLFFVGILGIAWLRVAVFITIGIGCHFAAEALAFSHWKKWLAASGCEQRILHDDMDSVILAYNKLPGMASLQYLETVNAALTSELRRMLTTQI